MIPLGITLEFTTAYNLVFITISTVLAYTLSRAAYNLFFSPLRAIPGPWYAAVSDAWLAYHTFKLEKCKTVHQALEKYGPIVRVGPKKVVFRDLATSRNVYTVQKFDKSTIYQNLITNNKNHAITIMDHATHAIRRKAYFPQYQLANVFLYQPEIQEAVLEMVEKLNALEETSAVECLQLFRHLLMDIIVNISCGFRLKAIKEWASGDENMLSNTISDFPKRSTIKSSLPGWAWPIVSRFPNRRWQQICDSDRITAEFLKARVDDVRNDMTSGKLGDSEKIPLLQRLLSYRTPSGKHISEAEIISEAMGHLNGGTETSAISLSYLLWELTRRPDVMHKLRAEVDSAMPDAKSIPDLVILSKLTYLNAFIKEGLRLYGSVPSLLERTVPVSDKGFDMMGFFLPPGTVVATQAWSVHRDASVFPSPETFLPERWLEIQTQKSDNKAELAKMDQHMMPFGIGSRLCGGWHLALSELKICVSAIVRNFDVSAPPETNERSMEMSDKFAAFPSSGQCKLIFTPRRQT